MLIVIITMVMMILMTMIKVLVIFPHKRHSICKKLNDHCLVRHHLTFKRIGQAGEVKTEVQQEQISWQSWRLGHWGPLWATEGHWGPLRATEGHRGPLRATEGHWGPLRATEGHWGPPRATEGHWGQSCQGQTQILSQPNLQVSTACSF